MRMTLPTLMGAVFLAGAAGAQECDTLFQVVGWGGGDVPTRELTSQDFTAEGTKAFARYTKDNVRRPLAVIYDGEVITAPFIREPILGGQAHSSGNLSRQGVEEMARNLTQKTCPPEAEP